MEEIFRQIDGGFSAGLEAIREALGVENTLDRPDVCGEFCRRIGDEIRDLGGVVSIREYGDLPALVGRIDAGAPRTLLIYRNYDIVPAPPARWKVPPFSGAVLDLEGVGEAVVGRGAADPKGPLIAFLRAIRAIRSAGRRPPLNLVFLLEGDEQIGSPTLPKLLRDRRKDLAGIDGVLIPVFSESYSGVPVISLGFKGMLLLELICAGGAWGGPVAESLHSSNAAWIGSPAWRLIQALSTLVTEDEEVAVEGFHDDLVHSLEAEETPAGTHGRDMLEYLRTHHVHRFQADLPDPALFRRYLLRPTFNISNLLIHPPRVGSGIVLPREARAWVDIRLVPEMKPDRILERIGDHLAAMGFPDIETVTHISYPPYRIDEEDPMVRALKRVYERFGRHPEIHPASGISRPVAILRESLGTPVVVGGLGAAGRAFHENEYACLEGIRDFQKSMVEFLHEFARV